MATAVVWLAVMVTPDVWPWKRMVPAESKASARKVRLEPAGMLPMIPPQEPLDLGQLDDEGGHIRGGDCHLDAGDVIGGERLLGGGGELDRACGLTGGLGSAGSEGEQQDCGERGETSKARHIFAFAEGQVGPAK